MRQVLVINSSVTGPASVSRILVEHTVQSLLDADPKAVIVYRDLDADPVPHLTSATVAGVRGLPSSDDELASQARSDELIEELRAADILVIGAPMYNFSIPTSLRAWFDHVLRPRVTFSYSERGPQGLLTGKRAIVIEPRGGLYSSGPAKVTDFQEPYLRQLLGFVGITDVTFIHAEKIGFGPEAREAAVSTAKARIAQLSARIMSSDAEPAEGAPSATGDIDFAAILGGNLKRVFGEHDSARRLAAIQELYAPDAILHEPDRSVQGHEAISQAVTELLNHLPPDFGFTAVRPALGHNGVGRLQWTAGPPGGPEAVTGLDVAHIELGVIKTLHVFLDPQSA